MKVLGYNLMQATRFAVEEISNDSSLLPSVLLGYEMVDTCYMSNNVHPVLSFLSQDDYFPPIQEDYSHYVPRVVAIIGPENSESPMTVAHFLSLSLLPQLHFPAVLHTAPGVHHQMEAMVQLMLHFRWNWILVLTSSDDYGRGNSQLLSECLAHHDICIAFQETLPMPQPNQTMMQQEPECPEAIVGKLQQSMARAVAVFSPDLALFDFFREVLRQNFTGAVWIASESWAIEPVLHHLTQLQRTGTFLGITTQSVPIPGFSEFRARRSQLLPEIWKVNFTLLGHQIFFNEQGDLSLYLEVIQWQWDLSQNPFQSIASYQPSKRQLKDICDISWHTPNNTIPVSMCSKDCQPGQKKKPAGIHPCCFECIDCLSGTFLNRATVSDAHGSLGWGARVLPDADAAADGIHGGPHVCRAAHGLHVPLPPGLLHALLHCLHLLHHRALFPDHLHLQDGQTPPTRLRLLVRYHGPYVFVAFITVLKTVIVGSSILAVTTNPTAHTDPDDPKITTLSCNPSYHRGLLINTSLDLLVSVLGFGFTYIGKELPTNYYEAKFITFCMTFYFTSSVFLCTFMSVYEGVLVTILDLLVTVLHLLGVTLGYFGPKCYMILFYLELNTPAYFNSMIQGYTMGRD
eukprot:bmy_13309T0